MEENTEDLIIKGIENPALWKDSNGTLYFIGYNPAGKWRIVYSADDGQTFHQRAGDARTYDTPKQAYTALVVFALMRGMKKEPII